MTVSPPAILTPSSAPSRVTLTENPERSGLVTPTTAAMIVRGD